MGDDLEVRPDLPASDRDRVVAALADALGRADRGGRRAAVATVMDAYATLDDTGRRRFLGMLAETFGTDPDHLAAVIARWMPDLELPRRLDAEADLRAALTPPLAEVLHLCTGLHDGVKRLVDLRADLLRVAGDEPELRSLADELRALLVTLFDAGLLELHRITWDAPASLLEKLAAYEAVHEIESWVDLKSRLDDDRRWYAFFHPAMPTEPLIFVEIALTDGITRVLADVLRDDAAPLAPNDATTAIFYSISSCQPGLAGVNLGNALLKQVVEELRRDLPGLATFATLSPIPGFRRWAEPRLAGDDLTEHERARLPGPAPEVARRLGDDRWVSDEAFAAAVAPALLALGARYLTTTAQDRVLDPVENFHLSNGAAIERLNWMANPTAAGLRRSFGMMANYRYEPERIDERAEAYAARGSIPRRPAVDALLAP